MGGGKEMNEVFGERPCSYPIIASINVIPASEARPESFPGCKNCRVGFILPKNKCMREKVA